MKLFEFIDAKKASYPVAALCEVLGVSRREPSRRDRADAALTDRIRVIYEKSHRTYGGGSDDAPESYYVGDATFDVWAAKAAGMRSIAVSWGVASEEKLRSSGPDHLVPDVPSAVEVILAESDG